MAKLNLKKEKEVVEENKHYGTDYNSYVLDSTQTISAIVAGLAIGFLASYIYFGNMILGIIVGLFAGYKAIGIYRNSLQQKRAKELRIQFRDMLESLSNSYTVGMNAPRAFEAAYSDMVLEHGSDAYITKEIENICIARDNGAEIKDLLNDFAARSGIDDIRSFASVFEVSTELGGDISKVIRESRDMINDKTEIELEIQTMVTGQRSQLNTLAIMPIVMSLLTRSFSAGNDSSALVVVVKVIALCVFVFAYWLGTKIVDIKV